MPQFYKMKKLFIYLTLVCGALSVWGNRSAHVNTAIQKGRNSSEDSAKILGFALSPIIDFNAYLKLAQEVYVFRQNRLISLDTFLKWSKCENVLILDTRSDSLFRFKHLKGAVHLDFSDFTQESIDAIIPDTNTKILIYCNNNFKNLTISGFYKEPNFFVSKAARPVAAMVVPKLDENKNVSLALNIPTFINLVGYGYKNVYELGEQVFVFDERLEFEGLSVQ